MGNMNDTGRSIEDILKDLSNKDVNVRVKAIKTASKSDQITPQALLAMAKLLSDKSPYDPDPTKLVLTTTKFVPAIGEVVASILPEIGKKVPGTIQDLLRNIPEMSGHERVLALDTICAVGPIALENAIQGIRSKVKDMVPILEEVLHERRKYPSLCAVAIRVLGTIGEDSESAIPTIIRFLSITSNGSGAGADLGGYRLIGALDSISSPSKEAVNALSKIGPKTIPALSEVINSTDLALLIIPVLERLGRESVPALVQALQNESKKVRMEATRAIAQIGYGSSEAIEGLQAAIVEEKGWWVRHTLRKALKKIQAG